MSTRLLSEYDVVVAGGGTAGAIAAIASARTGARTALIEQHGYVGGVASTGLPFHGFFNNREERIVGGIPWEMVSRLREMDAVAEVRNVAVGEPRGRGSAKFNAYFLVSHPEAVKYVLLEMLRESGVDLFLHTWVSGTITNQGSVSGVVVENKSGSAVIPSARVIDCTGDADLAVNAGGRFEIGRPKDGIPQPMTLMFTMTGIDLHRADDGAYVKWPYEVIGSDFWRSHCAGYTVRLDRWNEELQQEIPEFAPTLKQFNVWDYGTGVLYCGNMIHIAGLRASDGAELSKAEIDARRLIWRLARFARRHIPGFEDAHLVGTADHIGIRESRRIVGDHRLSYEDIIEARRHKDDIALGGYRVDIHGYDGGPIYNEPKSGTQVKDYGAYGIPYRCLIPVQVENLLVAGRCISASHEAQGSCRVMGTAMAMGHAAGVAAALSAERGVTPRQLDVEVLQGTLNQQEALLGR